MAQITNEKTTSCDYYYVYVAYCKTYKDHSSRFGFIKIGISKNYKNRLSTLQKNLSNRLLPAYLLGVKSRQLAVAIEYYFHKKYDNKKVENEWFRYTKEMHNYFRYNLKYFGDDLTLELFKYKHFSAE